jgi:hypothetical protein
LGISLVLLVLLDALITRTGWKLPEFVKWEKRVKVKKVKAPKPVVAKVEVAEKKEGTPAEAIAPSARRSRFQKAKDRK